MVWQTIEMNKDYEIQVCLLNGNYNFQILSIHNTIISSASVVKKITTWHLNRIYTYPEYRKQCYATILLNKLREYLWSIEKLGISVHPGCGEQSMEDLALKYKQITEQQTPEEIDKMTKLLEEESKNPDFWDNQAKNEVIHNSEYLIKWYKKNGFISNLSDLNDRILLCYPD